jgi:hypothetical protein
MPVQPLQALQGLHTLAAVQYIAILWRIARHHVLGHVQHVVYPVSIIKCCCLSKKNSYGVEAHV